MNDELMSYYKKTARNRPLHRDIPTVWFSETISRHKKRFSPRGGDPGLLMAREVYLAGSWVEARLRAKDCFSDEYISRACMFLGMKLCNIVVWRKDFWGFVKRFVQYGCKRPYRRRDAR